MGEWTVGLAVVLALRIAFEFYYVFTSYITGNIIVHNDISHCFYAYDITLFKSRRDLK